LAEKGEDVTVFERKGQVGNDVCSGLFSQRILDFIPQSRILIKNEIKSVVLHFPKKDIKINFSKSFLVMSHSELDKILAGFSQKAGAKINLDHNISSLPEGFDKIIGCDGWDSIVRKSLKLPNPSYRLGILGYINTPLSSDFVEAWPHKENGFIWKIPRGSTVEYGIIGRPERINKIFNNFLKEKNIVLNEIKAKIIPQGFLIPQNRSITLCGDAIGLTKPWSGGGVIWGLKTGDLLLETFPNFLAYRKQVKRFFGLKIFRSKIITKLVYSLGFKMPFLLPKNVTIESDFLF
jgi:flavin-dependent dehydrogenase